MMQSFFNQDNPWGQPNDLRGSFRRRSSSESPFRKFWNQYPWLRDKGPLPILGLIVCLLGTLWLLSGFYQVNPDEQGLVLRFGRWVQTTEPGWHYHLPSPIEQVLKPRVTLTNQIPIGEANGEDSHMLTGDRNIVDVGVIVQWHIRNAPDYLFNLREPEQTIRAVTESVIREIMGRMPIDHTFAEGRAEIQQQAKEHVQKILDSYHAGVQITEVNLSGVNPPPPVIESFREVDRANADRERLFNEAESYRNDVVPKARGEASHIVQDALAYKEATIARAQGEASRFLSIGAEYAKNPDSVKKRLYYETMERVYKDASKILMPSKGAPFLPHMAIAAATPKSPSQGEAQ